MVIPLYSDLKSIKLGERVEFPRLAFYGKQYYFLLFAFLAAYAANLAFLASSSYKNTMQKTDT